MSTTTPKTTGSLNTEQILADKEVFCAYTYTHWEDALTELEARSTNKDLAAYVENLLPHGVPEAMKGKKSMVLFRHIATPNYEVGRFVMAADALNQLHPLVLEYTEDKFTNRNDWKFSLAKLRFQKGHNKLGQPIFESKTVIDINDSNFKPICDIKTHWGQSLVEFHHELFDGAYPHLKNNVNDLSSWLHEVGPAAKDYYKAFLSLYLKDGILFENFLIDSKEYEFTRDIILPAIQEIEAETGMKPLIVALEPTHIEGDEFWLSHPFERKQHVDNKLQSS